MKTDNSYLSNSDFFKQYYDSIECVKMNTSNTESDQNSSLINNDSGYLTNYNQESQICSSSSSTSTNLSSEDFYPQKLVQNEFSLSQNNVYFCENAVFDEPKLEGPPILLEDISVDLNGLLQPNKITDFGVNFGEKSTIILEVPPHGPQTHTNQGRESYKPQITNLKDSASSNFYTSGSSLICYSESAENSFENPLMGPVQNQNSPNTAESPILSQNHGVLYSKKLSLKKLVRNEDCSLGVSGLPQVSFDSQNNSRSSDFVVPSSANIPKFSTPSRGSADEKSNSSLKSSGEKMVLNTSDSETSFSSQTNEFPFENLRLIGADESNSTISSVASNSEDGTDFQSTKKVVQNTTPNKPIIPKTHEISPDLFSDEDYETEIPLQTTICVNLTSVPLRPLPPIEQNEQYLRNDRKLVRRVQEAITGVPPPPSVTIIQTTVNDMLNKIYNNKHLFLSDIFNKNVEQKTDLNISCDNDKTANKKSLLICNKKSEILDKNWPEIVNYRYHGLHFNRTKVSEDFEFYCMKYQNRFVGVDTASSCTVWSTNLPSSAKKRNARLRWTAKSPGRRLSHLAKRRITFSSSNLLQANCKTAANLSVIGSINMASKQLVIDTRKSQLKRKSPWKKSPRKNSPLKKIRTPSSSSKKANMRLTIDEPQPGPSRMISTKRALFQSPDHNRSTTSTSSYKPRSLFFGTQNSPNKNSPSKNSPLKFKNSPNKFGSENKSRRNLFVSPKKASPAKNMKRKRSDDEGSQINAPKIPRSLSFEVDRKNENISFQRRHSEISIKSDKSRVELSDLHKKKLLWAVSEALRTQNIGMSNPNFRKFAPILCKIVKFLMPDLLMNGPRIQGSTSDRMLKIARQHVFAVTRGKNFDEIISEIQKNEPKPKILKPIGYIPPENYNQKNVLQDRILNIEANQNIRKSPNLGSQRSPNKGSQKSPRALGSENNKAKLIKRQILFDDDSLDARNQISGPKR